MLKILVYEASPDGWVMAEYDLLEYLTYMIKNNYEVDFITSFVVAGAGKILGYIVHPDYVDLSIHGYEVQTPILPWSTHKGEFETRMANEAGKLGNVPKYKIVKGNIKNAD